MAFDISHLVELTPDPTTRIPPKPGVRLPELIEQARAAEDAGLDVFAFDQHRSELANSAPAVVLAAMADNTRNIKLSSAVTVPSSDHLARDFQRFATLDLVSTGRTEIIARPAPYTDSFPLFGYGLDDPVTWPGSVRPELRDAAVTPQPERGLPVWVAAGGAPASVVGAARLGLPLSLDIICGSYRQVAPDVMLYRQAAKEAGHDPAQLKVSISSPGFIASTHGRAVRISRPYFHASWTAHHPGRGQGVRMPRRVYEALVSPSNLFFFGSPQEVIDKVMEQYALFRHDRMMIQTGFGGVAHKETMKSIELFGSEVAPVVRREIASLQASIGRTSRLAEAA